MMDRALFGGNSGGNDEYEGEEEWGSAVMGGLRDCQPAGCRARSAMRYGVLRDDVLVA
ncbi:hypothetical protein [Kribbella pittospori]|uniref:hypothetical protein n=1 Tax=Kribbella pittospori TaxID=722689 RepID=UPI0013F47AFD|nr:hypothetical protein [Kribbella pittospori]